MQPSPADEVRDMYDETADSYAQMMDAEIGLPIYADVLGRLQRRIASTVGPVVDTACGSGHMLSMYRERYDSGRPLVGIDLSTRMVEIAAGKLDSNAALFVGDMRVLDGVESASCAAVVNFFALHHLDAEGAQKAFAEWYRVLAPGGQLIVATWEGSGTIDYGDQSEIVALMYSRAEIESWAKSAGFEINSCRVEPVEDFPMDAVYLEASRLAT
jgi:ubiquinone/menaquinone biosynthesis C-methylase UbiE